MKRLEMAEYRIGPLVVIVGKYAKWRRWNNISRLREMVFRDRVDGISDRYRI